MVRPGLVRVYLRCGLLRVRIVLLGLLLVGLLLVSQALALHKRYSVPKIEDKSPRAPSKGVTKTGQKC